MKIGLIDNDYVSRKNHNFPNLALMKISAYHKNIGNDVKLIGFNEINPSNLFNTHFDKVIISKAFTDSFTPDFVYNSHYIEKGGTGFYYDKAENLPHEIEHSMPDYHLYDNVLKNIKNTKYYKDFSIGYTSRGCFRRCDFCVNKNSSGVLIHSKIDEFLDESRPKIALLDDNILGLPDKLLMPIFDKFIEVGKPIQYKQGMDIRLMTEKRAKKIIELKYESDYIFAFDNWKDKDIIQEKLRLFYQSYHSVKNSINMRIPAIFYVFCAFDFNNEYDLSFWENDILLIFKRIEILFKYGSLPFIMRYKEYENSPFRKLYIELTQWANQPRNCAKYSFNEYIDIAGKSAGKKIRDKYPELRKLFDLKLTSRH